MWQTVYAGGRNAPESQKPFHGLFCYLFDQAGKVFVFITNQADIQATAFVPRAISRFNARFPGVKATIQDLITAPMLNGIAHGEVDLGIGLRFGSMSDLAFSKIMDDRPAVVMRADHCPREFDTA